MAHIVRGAWTTRCSENIHGHSYQFELFLEGDFPDQGQMLYDFGLIKKYMNDFFDSFDHAIMLKSTDTKLVEFCSEQCMRVLVVPFNPTAEMQAKFIFFVCSKILETVGTKNMAKNVSVHKVIVHETATGYGEYSVNDMQTDKFPDIDYLNVKYSEGVMKEWSSNLWHKQILKDTLPSDKS